MMDPLSLKRKRLGLKTKKQQPEEDERKTRVLWEQNFLRVFLGIIVKTSKEMQKNQHIFSRFTHTDIKSMSCFWWTVFLHLLRKQLKVNCLKRRQQNERVHQSTFYVLVSWRWGFCGESKRFFYACFVRVYFGIIFIPRVSCNWLLMRRKTSLDVITSTSLSTFKGSQHISIWKKSQSWINSLFQSLICIPLSLPSHIKTKERDAKSV